MSNRNYTAIIFKIFSCHHRAKRAEQPAHEKVQTVIQQMNKNQQECLVTPDK
jgi:hypothetical protein